MTKMFDKLCLHANDPSLCDKCNGYGLKKHTHQCLGCRWTTSPHVFPECTIPPTVDYCIMCRAEHPWIGDLRIYIKMLDGRIGIPHLGTDCGACRKAVQDKHKYYLELWRQDSENILLKESASQLQP